MRTDGWAEGQTDMTKPIVAFRYFSNVPKTYLPILTKTCALVFTGT
jgi:hypothetical protein